MSVSEVNSENVSEGADMLIANGYSDFLAQCSGGVRFCSEKCSDACSLYVFGGVFASGGW